MYKPDSLKKVVMYHGACLDGSTAAAVFKMAHPDDETIFIPVKSMFDKTALELATQHIDKDTHVFFLDTTFLVNEVKDLPAKLTIIDHHESAVEMGNILDRLPNIKYIFELDKSGASLAWSYFFPEKPLPKFVWHMEDLDLWLERDFENTDKVASYASVFVDQIDKFVEFINQDIQEIYEQGELLVKYKNMLIDYYLRNAQALHLKVGEHVVKAFNVASIRPIVSAFGRKRSEQTKEAVCMFKVFGERVNLSFRSTDKSRVSAQELAETLGGGGHKNSAGASMLLKDFFANLTDIQDN